MQIMLVLAILGLPTVSPGAADLLRLARLDDCAAPAPPSAFHRQLQSRMPPVADLPALPPSTPAMMRAASMMVASPPMPWSASPPTRAVAPPPAVAPSSSTRPSPDPLQPSPSAKMSAVIAPRSRQAAEKQSSTSTTITTSRSSSSSSSSSSPPPATSLPLPAASSTLQKLASSGLGLLTQSSSGAAHLLTNLQLHGQLDVDDMVLGILVACLVLAVIATLGLTIACSRTASCARRFSSTLYFVTSLPVWAALSFVTAMCFVFRKEAETLVERYWRCLLLTEPEHKHPASQTAWGAASAVYQSITLTASMLLACNVLLLAGLYSAGHVIGWGTLAANLLTVINCGQLLVGGGLVAVAVGLHSRSDGSIHADAAMVALGVGVLTVSSLGLLGSRLHSGCLLRAYSFCSMLITLALCAFVAGLSALGVEGLADNTFVATNWHYVADIYPITQGEFMKLLGHHWSKLMIASSLLAFIQLLVLCASCILRQSLAPTRPEMATKSEQAGLIADEDEYDDDDDGGGVV